MSRISRARLLGRGRVLAGFVAAIPLTLGLATAGATSSAAATSETSNFATAATPGGAAATSAAARSGGAAGSTSAPGNFPPLPEGVRYVPQHGRADAMGGAPGQAGAGAGGGQIPAALLPPGDRFQPPRRVSAAALGAARTTRRSLATAVTPASAAAITSISCWSASGCMAVGWYFDAGRDRAYALRWNGSSWANSGASQYTISHGAINNQSLYGVSCSAVTNCVAVGYSQDGANLTAGVSLAEHWNGTHWTMDMAPAGGPYPELEGVSCVSATFCEAVGEVNLGVLAQTWNGSSWAANSATGSGTFYGVSCPSATLCLAAGEVGYQTMVMQFNGSAWSAVMATDPGTSSNGLEAISCPTTTFCTAVGYQESYPSFLGLIERIAVSGTTSSVTSTTSGDNPGISYTELAGVSCTSSTFCTAIGRQSSDGGLTQEAFSETWRGSGAWSAVTTPSPGQYPEDGLSGISCTSPTTCYEGGLQWSPPSYTDGPLLAKLSRGAFALQTAPVVRAPESYFDAVSCSGAKFCMAVGTSVTASGSDGVALPLVELWNGTSWRSVQAPNQAGYATYLYGVSCTSASFCLLVGKVYPYYGPAIPVAITFEGSSFVVRSIPISPLDNYNAGLYGVSCVSASSCLAVGEDSNPAFSVGWNGRSMSVTAMPQPGSEWAEPDAVSCLSSTLCYSVVEYGGQGGTQSDISKWNGSSWSVPVLKAAVAGATALELEGIDCVSTTRCVAVGEAYDISGSSQWQAVATTFNGRQWAYQVLQRPYEVDYAYLQDVSCTSSTACTAVGGVEAATNVADEPMTASLSGETWSAEHAIGTGYGDLYSISCPSRTLCVAAGEGHVAVNGVTGVIFRGIGSAWKAS